MPFHRAVWCVLPKVLRISRPFVHLCAFEILLHPLRRYAFIDCSHSFNLPCKGRWRCLQNAANRPLRWKFSPKFFYGLKKINGKECDGKRKSESKRMHQTPSRVQLRRTDRKIFVKVHKARGSIWSTGENWTIAVIFFLYQNVAFSSALADHDQIFMILIAYERAMLLLYDRHNNSIGLMDSHAHLSTCLVDSGERLSCSWILWNRWRRRSLNVHNIITS